MNISSPTVDGVAVVRLEGRLDALASPELEAALKERVDAGESRFALDFAAVPYLSSAGLRVLATIGKPAAAHGGGVCFFAVRQPVLEVLDISGFAELFPVLTGQDEAVAALRAA